MLCRIHKLFTSKKVRQIFPAAADKEQAKKVKQFEMIHAKMAAAEIELLQMKAKYQYQTMALEVEAAEFN
jgi:hypothetical protein